MRLSFEKCVTAVLFAAVCAYLGARLFEVLTLRDSLVLLSETVCESVRFEGIALRDEIPLGIPPEKVRCSNGERIASGYELAGGVVSPASAIYLDKCDGFEYLSPAKGNITADIVSNLLNAKPHPKSQGVLVTGRFWYCAVLTEGEISGGRCVLEIDGIDGRITGSAARGDGGSALIRIPIGKTEYLLARHVTGKIILNEYKGFAVPDSAVYEKDGKVYVRELSAAGETELEAEVLYSHGGKTVLKSGGKLLEGMSVKRDGSR